MKKRIFPCVIWVVVFTVAILARLVNAQTVITTCQELQDIQNNLSGTFVLGADINCTGFTFTPIAGDVAPDILPPPFSGTLDGQNHIITGLSVIRPVGTCPTTAGDNFIALIGVSTGTIRDIIVENATMEGRAGVAALVGRNTGTIENAHAIGANVTALSTAGGLVGANSLGGIITDSSAQNVSVTSTRECRGPASVGGLVGTNGAFVAGEASVILRSFSTGTVTALGRGTTFVPGVGGLVGGNIFDGIISQSFSEVTVSGPCQTGGLAGGNSVGGEIFDSYATGAVSSNPCVTAGGDDVGGLVGINAFGGASIANSYSIGLVTHGTRLFGGAVGEFRADDATCTAVFWDTQTSGLLTSACGTGETTANMQTQSTFTNAGWDFISIWAMRDYPCLQWEPGCECGNGIVDPGEICDDAGESLGCDSDCTAVACGDGVLNATAGEICDDGNTIGGDGCSADCLSDETCGNGIVDPGEICDDAGESLGCDSDCTAAVCGDGVLNATAGEICDDGNNIDGDGCDNDCTVSPFCGNGNLDAGEECDDGNNVSGDGCSATCVLEFCGDGVLQPALGEICDDGLLSGDPNVRDVADDADSCANGPNLFAAGLGCRMTQRCGDGILLAIDSSLDCQGTCPSAIEECDNGDGLALITPPGFLVPFIKSCFGDGVPGGAGLCEVPEGTGIPTVECGAAGPCGNFDLPDACRTNCTLPACGDGFVDSGEACDDGNKVDGDGCSSLCIVEIVVKIDLKPGSNPSTVNLGSMGVTPLAIFGSAGFDATQIDISTLVINGQVATVAVKGKGKVLIGFEDLNNDGFLDAVIKFDTEGLALIDNAPLALTGKLSDGTPFKGDQLASDPVKVINE